MEQVPQAAGEDGVPSVDDSGLIADMRWLGELAARIIKDPSIAEDACQDAWLRATHSDASVPFRTELHRGVRRFLHRHWRGERRRKSRERDVSATEEQPSVAELLIQREQQARLWSALLELEEPYRSTLVLRFQAGLSTGSIAARLEAPEDTIRWRIRRGTERLRQRIAADEDGGGLRALALALPIGKRGASGAATPPLVGAPWFFPFPQFFGVVLMLKGLVGIAATMVVVIACVVFAGSRLNKDMPAPLALDAPETRRGELPLALADLPDGMGSRQAVQLAEPASEEPISSEDEAGAQSLNPPLLRLHLVPSPGTRIPESFTVTVSPFFAALGITGYPVVASFGQVDGSVEIPLITSGKMDLFISGSVALPTEGIVIVTGKGLGSQSSGVVDVGWSPGEETDVALTLVPVTSLDVVAVQAKTGEPVKQASYRIEGPGSKFGANYESAEGGPVCLSLAPDVDAQDRIYVRGDGIALKSWTREELLELPVRTDGLRHLELISGCTVHGLLEMEAGAPIPDNAEIRYTSMRRDAAGELHAYPNGIVPDGRASITASGRFVIPNVPPGTLFVHLRERGRFVFETKRLSPDVQVEVSKVDELGVRVVVPANDWTFTINVPWSDDSPWQSNTLVSAALYKRMNEEDAPYANPSSSRQLLGQAGLFCLGDDAEIKLLRDAIEDGETYLLSIGANEQFRLERRITFQGLRPCLDYTIPSSARDELGLQRGRQALGSEERQARQNAAREAGGRIRLRAQTGLPRKGPNPHDAARNNGELAREILERHQKL